MPKSIDYPITMWERVLPRKGIRTLRKENMVEVIPWSHLVGIFLLMSCPTVTLGQVFRGKIRDIHRFISLNYSRRLNPLPSMEKL
jgi:hypothetical protein